MKNKKVYGLVGIAALAAVGGTFAYYSAEQTFTNPFNTTNYGSQATEKFNPADGDEWTPGVKVNKDVYATNTGDGDVWVRVKFDESWKLANNEVINHHSVKDDGTRNPLFDIDKEDREDWVPTANTDRQPSEDNGIAYDEDKGTVVYKEYANTVNAMSDATKGWFKGDDGYYYYNVALEGGEQSAKLLDSVTLAKNTDMGRFDFKGAYLVLDKGVIGENDDIPVFDPNATDLDYYKDGEKKGTWVVLTGKDAKLPEIPKKPEKGTLSDEDYKAALDKYENDVKEYEEKYGKKDIFTYKEDVLNSELQGYANADYNLDITVEFVQADKDAAAGWDSSVVAELVKKMEAKKN